jgi:hypothetical protein
MKKALDKREEEKKREAARRARMKRRETYWKPKPGTNRIRIMPPWTNEGPNSGQFWREIYVHFGVTCFDSPDPDSAFTVTCPRQTPYAAEALGLEPDAKISCPICEAVDALRQSQDPTDMEMAKQSRASQNFYSNIIDLDDPVWTQKAIDELKAKNVPEDFLPELGAPKVQVYRYGTTVMNMVLDFFSDNTDITDLVDGRDLFLEREGEGLKTRYRLRPNLQPTEAPIEDEQLDETLENLDNILPFFSTEQMDAVLAGASPQEVFGMVNDSTPALEEGSEEPAGELPESTEEPEAAEETTEAPEEPEEPETAVPSHDAGEQFPPLDEDGDIDYAALTDEQIEDTANAEVTDEAGSPVHIGCFGAARQRDENDPDCVDGCGLYERCGTRIAFLDEEIKKQKAAAAKKKGAGKKKAGGKKKTSGKKAAGKKGNSKPKESPKVAGEAADDLEAEMRKALAGK